MKSQVASIDPRPDPLSQSYASQISYTGGTGSHEKTNSQTLARISSFLRGNHLLRPGKTCPVLWLVSQHPILAIGVIRP